MFVSHQYVKLIRHLFISMLIVLLSACGGSGSNNAPQHPVTGFISGFNYGTTFVYLVTGQTIRPLIPDSTGGSVERYSVEPALPAGLNLNPTTGLITGTPTTLADRARYTVTATNEFGSASIPLLIGVRDSVVVPAGLFYSCGICDVTLGSPISPLVPRSQLGQVTNYSIAPALPAGLSIDPTSGIISGTPVALSALTQYTITASNSAGMATYGIQLSVQSGLQPPARVFNDFLVYDFPTGRPIVPTFLLTEGGQVTNFSVTPALPTGLSINANNGLISGTPTVNTPQADYVITGSNAAGSQQTTITITVQPLQPPSNLRYEATNFNFSINLPVVPRWPNYNGSQITEFSVTPDLPAGLNLDVSNGGISGTPTAVTAATAYVITGKSSLGQTQTTLTLATQAVSPGFQNGGSLYYDGALTWTKITDTTYDYPGAVNYCANLPPYNGGAWELPVDVTMILFDDTQVSKGNLNGHGWVFGNTFVNLFTYLESALRGRRASFGYFDFNQRLVFFNIQLPETANYLVTCVNSKAL